jgi:peptidoglycan/xylan/chitin deacetylase (PgdA/CDA1 family)
LNGKEEGWREKFPNALKTGIFVISHTGRIHQLLFPWLEWRINSPNIFLTFDDGPHPAATPAVLNVLKTQNVKATFFLSGAAAAHFPSLVGDIAAEGHSIGIHAFNHTRRIAFSMKETVCEILQAEEAITKAAPRVTKLFRPPFGFFSWNTVAAARTLNYRLIMWTTLCGDFRSNWSDEKVVATALTKLSGGSILVFHDNELTKTRIAAVLTQSIEKIRDHGFTFDSIS